jgi:hypothetical protein
MMKRITCTLCALLVGAGFVLAEGGKNQGETGSGDTSTGDQAQGQADQSRAGRDDTAGIIEIMEQGE